MHLTRYLAEGVSTGAAHPPLCVYGTVWKSGKNDMACSEPEVEATPLSSTASCGLSCVAASSRLMSAASCRWQRVCAHASGLQAWQLLNTHASVFVLPAQPVVGSRGCASAPGMDSCVAPPGSLAQRPAGRIPKCK